MSQPTTSDVHIPTTDRPKESEEWSEPMRAKFFEIATKVFEETGDTEQAHKAGVAAAMLIKGDKMITKANHSKSQCMACKANPPTVDVLWNSGQSRAWFCDKCFGGWSLEKGTSIVNVNRLPDGVAPARYKVNHSPNEKRSASGQRSPCLLYTSPSPRDA